MKPVSILREEKRPVRCNSALLPKVVGKVALAAAIVIVVLASQFKEAVLDMHRLERPAEVQAVLETKPVAAEGDCADDIAIWVNPANSSLGVIIGTDKSVDGGLHLYDLSGDEIQFIKSGSANNVDIRYGFSLLGENVDLVVASDIGNNTVDIFRIVPSTRNLVDVAVRKIELNMKIRGICMYLSDRTGRYYFIATSDSHQVQQWELFDNGSGKVDGRMVRSFNLGSQIEGCVADDEMGYLYIAEEDVGIWKYGAEPDAGDTRTLVDKVGMWGELAEDVEGLTIYYADNGAGYLIASTQHNDRFVVYRREGCNDYIGTFEIVSGQNSDGAERTDGIDVTSANMGGVFSKGLFIAHDGHNEGGKGTNYKLVPWDSIAHMISPPLVVDTLWHRRRMQGDEKR